MFDKLRPFIFKFSPEVAHSLAIKALKLNAIPKKKIENISYYLFYLSLAQLSLSNRRS